MRTLILTLSILFLVSGAAAGEKRPIHPTPKDKCAVCGVLVEKYPESLAQIIYTDGSYAAFDGPKDLLKYYLDIAAFNPSKKKADIESVYVTDYLSLTPIDGQKAYYVVGCTLYGPIGKELIPFGKETDARQFMKDYHGKSVLKFGEVTATTLKILD